jgi:trigger factor
MDIKFDKVENTLIKVTISLDSKEYQPEFDKLVDTYGPRLNINGFRKGKIPRNVIVMHLGKDKLYEEATDRLLQEKYNEWLDKEGFVTYKNPDIKIINDPKEAKTPLLVAELTQTVFPKLEIPKENSYKIEVDDLDSIKVRLYDEKIKGLQKQFASLKTVDRKAKPGDFVLIDIEAKIGKEIVESSKKQTIELDKDQVKLEGLFDALIGKSAKETAKFKSKLVSGEHLGEDADIEVTVKSVKEQLLPKLDDDFAKQASEYESFDELQKSLNEQVDAYASYDQIAEARNKLIEELLKIDIEVPTAMLEEFENRVKMDIYNRADQSKPAETLKFLEENKDKITEDAKFDAKREVLFTTYARKNKIEPTQEQLSSYISTQAYQAQVDPQKYVDYLVEQNLIPMFVDTLRQSLAIDKFMEGADIKDNKGKKVKINEPVQLQGAGEDNDSKTGK